LPNRPASFALAHASTHFRFIKQLRKSFLSKAFPAATTFSSHGIARASPPIGRLQMGQAMLYIGPF
jgi:hypothetical protein